MASKLSGSRWDFDPTLKSGIDTRRANLALLGMRRVFGEPTDLVIMGSRTLEGLNFRIDPVTKQLVDAGPAPAAAT